MDGIGRVNGTDDCVEREGGGGSEGGGCVGVFIRIKSGKIKPME